MTLRVLAIDPAEYRIGWALGDAGTKPTVGVYRLRDKGEGTGEAAERFAKWLYNSVAFDLLAIERFLPAGALKGSTSAATREGAIGLHYAARAVCAVKGKTFESIYPQTIRKHFIGRASMGDSASTKAAVVKQAQLLGYLARDCFDTDMGDAAAIFDFASSHFGRKASAFSLMA